VQHRGATVEPYFITEAVVCDSFGNEFFGIIFIDRQTLALNIRPIAAVLVRPFIMDKPYFFKGMVNEFNVAQGKRQIAGRDDAIPCILEAHGNEKAIRKNWARLIQIIKE
jgi:hypothetical protein